MDSVSVAAPAASDAGFAVSGAVMAVAGWTLLMSALAYRAFARDKHAAQTAQWRVSEARLLGLAFFGGWPGALAGQRFLRHKTRKEPFRSALNAIVVANLLLLSTLLIPGVRHGLSDILTGLGEAIAASSSSEPPEPAVVRRF